MIQDLDKDTTETRLRTDMEQKPGEETNSYKKNCVCSIEGGINQSALIIIAGRHHLHIKAVIQ